MSTTPQKVSFPEFRITDLLEGTETRLASSRQAWHCSRPGGDPSSALPATAAPAEASTRDTASAAKRAPWESPISRVSGEETPESRVPPSHGAEVQRRRAPPRGPRVRLAQAKASFLKEKTGLSVASKVPLHSALSSSTRCSKLSRETARRSTRLCRLLLLLPKAPKLGGELTRCFSQLSSKLEKTLRGATTPKDRVASGAAGEDDHVASPEAASGCGRRRLSLSLRFATPRKQRAFSEAPAV